jgi:chromate transporter
MHEEVVEKRKWISESRFLHALNYCMLLPGPEATQLATYIGWLLHRTWGGILAGTLFFLPSVFILWGLSLVYVTFGKLPFVTALFYGLKPVVAGIVAAAVLRIGKKALRNAIMYAIAALAFVALFSFRVPFPIVIITAAVIGFVGGVLWPKTFAVIESHAVQDRDQVAHTKPTLGRAVQVVLISLLLWWTPVFVLGKAFGWQSVFFQQGVFFSKAAMVTFGGAYAVLPYVSQEAVEKYNWLSAPEMLDGLGLAETTPGPLIMVLQFVGFLGGWHYPGSLPPLLAATLGAFITTWTTFVPCFLWIFLGAPYIEHLRTQERLTAALSTVTAAVAGVILNLALWFGLHVIFPGKDQVDWFALAAAIITFIGMAKWKWNVVPVVLGGALAGWVYHLLK